MIHRLSILILINLTCFCILGFGQTDSSGSSVDSISMADSITQMVMPTTNLMAPGELAPISTPLKRRTSPKGWFFVLNCIMLGLLVVKFTVFQNYSRKSWNAWINENLFFQFIREKAPVNLIIVLIESVLKIYVVSVMILIFMEFFLSGFSITAGDLFRISVYMIIFYVVKTLFALLLAILTDHLELYKVMNLNAIIFSSNIIYFLIPLIMIVVYLSVPFRLVGVYLLLALFVLAIILLVFRALRIFLKARMPINLQFFLYLCAFEILPYLFLVKVLETNVVH